MIERIIHNQIEYAIIIRSNYSADGIQFFTHDEYSQQLAYMNRPKGYVIQPHYHNKNRREVYYTQEVLYIKSGRVQVNFYDEESNLVKSVTLSTGDVILLVTGGHGFAMLETTEMIEVKQGPYSSDQDKTHIQIGQEEEISIHDSRE